MLWNIRESVVNKFLKRLSFTVALLASPLIINSTMASESQALDEKASYKDAKFSFDGIAIITLSVADLDTMLNFYSNATGFDLIEQYEINDEPEFNTLYGQDALSARVAVLAAPNMHLKLIEFSQNRGAQTTQKPFYQQGITHTCYQSPLLSPSYNRFKAVGAHMLSRGDKPVDLGGYGITYAYGYDPEGNMFEMEHLADKYLENIKHDIERHPTWMSQVAFATADREALMSFYGLVLGFESYRKGEYNGNPRMDDIVNWDNVHLKGGWFKIDDAGKVLEVWEFIEPSTLNSLRSEKTTALGYSFTIDVKNLEAEYLRLKDYVNFISSPVQLHGYKRVLARDIEGNIFELREKL